MLRSVGGEPLPMVWISNESVAITVRADPIRMRDGSTGDRVVVQEYQEALPSAPAVRRETADFEFVQRVDRIELSFVCPGLALCVAPPHFVGRVTADGIVFDEALNYRVPLCYERVNR
jgi:hypothetical protein